MSNYKKIAEEALKKAKQSKKTLNESVLYPEGLSERMHQQLEKDLMNNTHSLSNHPIFPYNDGQSFEETIMGERFNEVVKRYKRTYDVNNIDNEYVMSDMMPLVYETMGLESKHKKELEELAINMIREEYNMSEDIVEIHAELTYNINMVGTKKTPKPITVEMAFKNHDDIVNAKSEVHKRRFINAMIQGAAKKCNHMFHNIDDELTNLDPRLPNKYSKIMASADYAYYITSGLESAVNGGVVNVQFPTISNPKAIIHVQAMVLPVLIHELVKGVMELISAHGLPENEKIGEYVIGKADFLEAEPWDMRLGPGIWGRFVSMIEPEDFNIKHQIYTELVSLPVNDFNIKMREIMAKTKDGNKIIDEIVKEIKTDLKKDAFNEAMNEISKKSEITSDDSENDKGFDFKDLFGNSSDLNSDDDSDDKGIDFDDLFKK